MKKQRTFVTADIHGSYRALMQLLKKVNFDYDNDRLIVLGDVVDGWSESMKVILELMKISNLVYIKGNHDIWFYEFLKYGSAPSIWLGQGGQNTLKSFLKQYEIEDAAGDGELFKSILIAFFENGLPYYEEDNRLFVHGGFDWHKPIEDQDVELLTWDRHLWKTALMWEKQGIDVRVKDYDEVFIGHTSTTYYNINDEPMCIEPQKASNVYNLDQGCGHEGVLTIMNLNTKEVFQSDYSKDLYRDEKPRG